jgi:hypothetical protein
MYYKVSLELTDAKDRKTSEIMFIQTSDIVKAMDISKKKRGSRFWKIVPIDRDSYIKGVGYKYN